MSHPTSALTAPTNTRIRALVSILALFTFIALVPSAYGQAHLTFTGGNGTPLTTTLTRSVSYTVNTNGCAGGGGPFFEFDEVGKTIGAAGETSRRITHGTDYEFEWRESQPGFGAGWFAAEELRRAGVDEPLVANQAIVWQSRIGAAAVVDTVLVSEGGPVTVTPPEEWPYKRIKLQDRAFDVPDVLARGDG